MKKNFQWSSRSPLLLMIVSIFLLLQQTSHALQIPPRPTSRISDYASVLSPGAKSRLESRLQQFEKDTSNQIVVAIFPSLEEESLDDFTNRLFEQWKLGQIDRNNGVLLAIFMKEKKVRIEVGYGLEGVLTDALSSRIIRDELAPEFRSGHPDAGIENAIIAIEKATRGEYKGKPESHDSGLGWGGMLLLFLVLLIVIYGISQSGRTIYPGGISNRRRRGGSDWWGGSSGGGWGGSSGGGWGGSSGGGFSGGGGMSGGGGASGGW
jgi:uncharacterized protein